MQRVLCEACGLQSDGKHFGKMVCRPCAGFYRRTIANELKYTCKANRNCTVSKELRKNCSFCRFERCKSIGMTGETIQMNRDKNGPLKKAQRSDTIATEEAINSPETSVGTNNLSPLFFTPDLPKESKLLDQLQEGISNYMKSEKFLLYMMYPESASKKDPLIRINHDDLVNMERGCLPLIQTLIIQFYPAYQELPTNIKAAILRLYHNTFSPLHKCYLNSLYGDCEHNFLLHFGQYVTRNDTFYANDTDAEFSWRSSDECIQRSFKICQQMRDMKVRECELGAICAIGLANDVGIVFKSDIMSDFRSQVFDQLHADIAKNYPPNEVGPRFSALISFLMDADFISNQVNMTVAIRKILNSNGLLEIFEE
ncbi:hypothetical protein M3Y97_00661400 [Aphelenchoides bicaudatus]|nr:hypothetical protein M3Y97_00661400 [Aphelenchoides bicaudatus]